MTQRKVMIFGVFDGIHGGHRYFFQEAKKSGDYLIAVVAKDHLVQKLKKRPPEKNLNERCRELRKEKIIDEVVPGDDELGAWDVVKKYRPEVIALGYDQQTLKENLETNLMHFDFHPEIKVLRAYQPGQYHNSIISGS